MSENLITLPDNKGGQLKFRVDELFAYTNEELYQGRSVDIYIKDSMIVFSPRDIDTHTLNYLMINWGRPKGYGMVVWHSEKEYYEVLWTPHIGDEGFFDDK